MHDCHAQPGSTAPQNAEQHIPAQSVGNLKSLGYAAQQKHDMHHLQSPLAGAASTAPQSAEQQLQLSNVALHPGLK